MIRPDGQTVALTYDGGGRPTAIDFSRGRLQHTYHPTGQLATVHAPGGETLTYSYDGFLLSNTSWSGPVAGSVGRTYDNNFHLISQSVNGADAVTFEYDADCLLTRAGALAIQRSPQDGLPTGTSLGQITTVQAYNGFKEITTFEARIVETSVFKAQYTRDRLGRILQRVETLGGTTDTYEYTYDAPGRLSEVHKNGARLSHYDYDDNSNRIAHITPYETITAAYDAQDRLLTYGDTTYTYTASGELASKTQNGQTVTYDHDEFGNLREVTLPDGIHIEYVIDGQNRRVGKKINGVLVQGFLYMDQIRPVAELDGSGAVVSRFVYGSRMNVPDYMFKDGRTYRIVSDHLGSPRLVIEVQTSDIAQRRDYDELGRVILDTNPGFQPFGFAGGIYDSQPHLVRFGARNYDPEIGRWTTKDPILFRGSDTSFYSYAFGDPVNLIDPSGLAWIWNQSNLSIPYKPEGHDYQAPALLQPGDIANVDGLYSPPEAENPIALKVPDNCVGIIRPCGEVKLHCIFLDGMIENQPRVLSPEDLRSDDLENWADPYTGRQWPQTVSSQRSEKHSTSTDTVHHLASWPPSARTGIQSITTTTNSGTCVR